MMRIGILGGTFDPIHLGHLDAAEAARRALALDRVLLVPSRLPPHRQSEPRASAFHRFAMTVLAAAERSMLASDLELVREGPSYTSLTLEALLRDGLSPASLFFIVGSDAFAEVESWHDYPRILELSNFAVVARPGFAPVAPAACVSRTGTQVFSVSASTADVASTEIRRRIVAREPIDTLVPAAVAEHIRRYQLYVPSSVPTAG